MSSISSAGSRREKRSSHGKAASRSAGRCQTLICSWKVVSSFRSAGIMESMELRRAFQTDARFTALISRGVGRGRSDRFARRGITSIIHSTKLVSSTAGSSCGGFRLPSVSTVTARAEGGMACASWWSEKRSGAASTVFQRA